MCIRDRYESVYGVIVNGRNKYLNTSLGIVNEENATLLPVKHVKSISVSYTHLDVYKRQE